MMFSHKGSLAVLRLEPGEGVLECIKTAFGKTKWKSAVILGGIGQLRDARIGFLKGKGDYTEVKYTKPHELVSLQGSVARNLEGQAIVHAHATISDHKNKAMAGHFFGGVAQITAEIFLLEASGLGIYRKHEEKFGTNALFCGR